MDGFKKIAQLHSTCQPVDIHLWKWMKRSYNWERGSQKVAHNLWGGLFSSSGFDKLINSEHGISCCVGIITILLQIPWQY